MSTRAYHIGQFSLRPDRELLSGRDVVPLNRKALAVLTVFAQAEGCLVTKQEVMDAVWPSSITVTHYGDAAVNYPTYQALIPPPQRRLGSIMSIGISLRLVLG